MSISAKEVEQIAFTARLEIASKDLDNFVQEFNTVLAQTEKLKEVDTTNVKPTIHVLEYGNVLRKDVVQQSLSQEAVLANAPAKESGGYLVPRVMEGGGA